MFREDENQNLVSFSALSFSRRSEARPECLGRRCQFLIKIGQDSVPAIYCYVQDIPVPHIQPWVYNHPTLLCVAEGGGFDVLPVFD